MSFEEKNKPAVSPAEEAEVETALGHFRASVRGWSEHEFARARTVRRSRWSGVWLTLASPALGWSLIAVLALSSAGVPVVVERQHQAAEQRQAALELERKQAAEEAARQAAASIDDEALLSGIDSDIAQAAPDAMQPLASLMSDSETRSAGTR